MASSITTNRVSEESVTAAYFGLLCSSIWDASIAASKHYGAQFRPPQAVWLHHTKNTEHQKGYDFGIITVVSGEKDLYRLNFFQAKLCVGNNGVPSFNSLIRLTRTDTRKKAHELDWKNNSLVVLAHILSEGDEDRERASEAKDFCVEYDYIEPKENQKENEKQSDYILQMNRYLQFRYQSLQKKEWCYYVGWHQDTAPHILAPHAYSLINAASHSMWDEPLNSLNFSRLLFDCLNFSGKQRGGLLLTGKKLKDITDVMSQLMPASSLLISASSPQQALELQSLLSDSFRPGPNPNFNDALRCTPLTPQPQRPQAKRDNTTGNRFR